MPAIETSQVMGANNLSESVRTTIPQAIMNYMKLKKGDMLQWERKIIKNGDDGTICHCVMIKKKVKPLTNPDDDVCPECGESNWMKNDIKETIFCVGCGYVKGDI